MTLLHSFWLKLKKYFLLIFGWVFIFFTLYLSIKGITVCNSFRQRRLFASSPLCFLSLSWTVSPFYSDGRSGCYGWPHWHLAFFCKAAKGRWCNKTWQTIAWGKTPLIVRSCNLNRKFEPHLEVYSFSASLLSIWRRQCMASLNCTSLHSGAWSFSGTRQEKKTWKEVADLFFSHV